MFKRYITLTVLVIILTVNCGKKSKDFNVDTSLLGEKYSNKKLGFQLMIPKGFSSVSKQEEKQIKAGLSKMTDIPLIPLKIYFNKKKGNTCIIARFNSETKVEDAIADYQNRLVNHFKDADVELNTFEHNGIKFHQIDLITEHFIDFKLIFPTKKGDLLQIDYIMSIKNYRMEGKNSIGASIGSIEYL